MDTLLHIDASPRAQRSISRQLATEFIIQYKQRHDVSIKYRDLGHNPVPLVTESWIEGAYTPSTQHSEDAKNAMSVSNMLVDELLFASTYVISTPMFNLSIPATLKAYIDQIVRVNRTFEIKNGAYSPLIHNKKMLIITSRGNEYGKHDPLGDFDFLEPYLKTIFGFIGITDITFVDCEGIGLGADTRKKAFNKAHKELADLSKTW